jgi:hypothetical protein
MKKIALIHLILGFLFLGALSQPLYSQEIDLLSFNRFTIPISFNGEEQLSSKTVFYSDFTSYDQPELVFFQQALQRNIGAWGAFSLSAQLIYRRYNLLPEGSNNEYRPVQVIGYAHKNAIQLRQRLRLEQRFKKDYSNRWWYSFDFNMFPKHSKFASRKITNDFLFDFNATKKSYENRLNIALTNQVLGIPIKIGMQYRTRKLFTGEPLKHLLVLRTDWVF